MNLKNGLTDDIFKIIIIGIQGARNNVHACIDLFNHFAVVSLVPKKLSIRIEACGQTLSEHALIWQTAFFSTSGDLGYVLAGYKHSMV